MGVRQLSGPIDHAARNALFLLRRTTAAHEAGHCVVAMHRGWAANYLWLTLNELPEGGFVLEGDAGRVPLTDLSQLPKTIARSISGAPPRPDDPSERRKWAHAGGAIAWGGVIAENMLRKENDLPLMPETLKGSAGDSRNFETYLAESGEKRMRFERRCKAGARAALMGHKDEWYRLTLALLEHPYLNVQEVIRLWHGWPDGVPFLHISDGKGESVTLDFTPYTPMEQLGIGQEREVLQRYVPRSLWPAEYLAEERRDAA